MNHQTNVPGLGSLSFSPSLGTLAVVGESFGPGTVFYFKKGV